LNLNILCLILEHFITERQTAESGKVPRIFAGKCEAAEHSWKSGVEK